MTLIHIVWACLRCGRWWHFLWPAPIKLHRWLKSADSLSQVRQALRVYVLGCGCRSTSGLACEASLERWHGSLCQRAFFLPPQGHRVGGAVALSLLGGLLLLLVVMHLPFLQAHLAQTERFKAIFEIREVRRMFLRAPLAFWIALFVTVLLAIPLYLLKIELTPRELAWLPALLFVFSSFPPACSPAGR